MTPGRQVYEHVRVCRDCGEEYRPEVARCADCGGELEDRRVGDAPAEEAAPAPGVDPAGGHALYRSSQVKDLVPMAERLRAAGIECWFVEQADRSKQAPPGYLLLVHEDAARAALAVVAELIAPHEGGADVHAIETRFEKDRGYLQCPACGAVPPAGARECPECGLGWSGEEAAEEPGP